MWAITCWKVSCFLFSRVLQMRDCPGSQERHWTLKTVGTVSLEGLLNWGSEIRCVLVVLCLIPSWSSEIWVCSLLFLLPPCESCFASWVIVPLNCETKHTLAYITSWLECHCPNKQSNQNSRQTVDRMKMYLKSKNDIQWLTHFNSYVDLLCMSHLKSLFPCLSFLTIYFFQNWQELELIFLIKAITVGNAVGNKLSLVNNSNREMSGHSFLSHHIKHHHSIAFSTNASREELFEFCSITFLMPSFLKEKW